MQRARARARGGGGGGRDSPAERAREREELLYFCVSICVSTQCQWYSLIHLSVCLAISPSTPVHRVCGDRL